MSEDESLHQKLNDLDHARNKVKAQIDESQAVLDAIGEKIETVKRQSKERLLQDDRVDNKLVMSAKHIKATETAARATQAIARANETVMRSGKNNNDSSGNANERVILVPNTLSEDDITVHPREPEKDKDKDA